MLHIKTRHGYGHAATAIPATTQYLAERANRFWKASRGIKIREGAEKMKLDYDRRWGWETYQYFSKLKAQLMTLDFEKHWYIEIITGYPKMRYRHVTVAFASQI